MSPNHTPENPPIAFKPPTEAQVADYAAGLGLPDPPAVARQFVACYAPEWREYRMEHSVCPQEIADIGDWLRRVLG